MFSKHRRQNSGNGTAVVDIPQPIPAPAKPEDSSRRELKALVHRKLIERLDLSRVTDSPSDDHGQVRTLIAEILDLEKHVLSAGDRDKVITEVLDETFGLGPLEALLSDDTISDILVNGPNSCYIERDGVLELTDVTFNDDEHLKHVIDRVVGAVGRRCDETSPMVDARLADGSRVNAIIPPLAIDGPTMSIRRFGNDPVTWEDYLRLGSLPKQVMELLRWCVAARLNILIAGGTGSGKTTLLNNLSAFIPNTDRTVTIEDTAELKLRQPHVVRLESRAANIEGKGQIGIRELLVNALRMRPDRLVVGECRSAETLDMLQAMNTGHDGSMTTIHANSTRDAVQRVETMAMMTGFDLPIRTIRQQFANAVDLIVQIQRLPGGLRKVTAVTEVSGIEGEIVTMQDIFKYNQEGVDAAGKVFGNFVGTGIRPAFLEKILQAGIEVDYDIFQSRVLSCEEVD